MASKAFLCGIDNYKSISDLRGCVNDTISIKKLLIDVLDFPSTNIELRHNEEVTKKELEKGWKWLLKNAKKGDRLVFHFSGHGSYTADVDNETNEADKRDELLCLYSMDWKDPESYLLDDELAKWTRDIPDGVHVTFILDCCHSGTGTRFVAPDLKRAVRGGFQQAGAHSLDAIATRRFKQTRSTNRSLERSGGVNPVDSASINEQSVLARFAPPPVDIQNAIVAATVQNSFLKSVTSAIARGNRSMNHVLWAGCRDDQTSADAFIGNGFHGAFSYYFCDTIRTLGAKSTSAKVLKALRAKLRSEHFPQVPQLEPNDVTSDIFWGIERAASGNNSDVEEEDDQLASDTADLPMSRKELEQLSKLVQRFLVQTGGTVGMSSMPTRASVGDKHGIVYIHGICSHSKGFSDDWWEALQSHLDEDIRTELSQCRKEVLWSKHVTSGERNVRSDVESPELSVLQSTMEAIMEDRMAREASSQIIESSNTRNADSGQQLNRTLLGIPGLDCADDFMKYLASDSIRSRVVAEATRVLAPLLAEERSIELISHSWGTVVAFEALHQLADQGLAGRVHSWFTVGAALSISFVAKRLRPSTGAKPHLVDNWININSKGDFVGGSLVANGLKPDQEVVGLKPIGCNSILGVFNPACAHSSYFNSDNLTVNKDIFAKWIQKQ